MATANKFLEQPARGSNVGVWDTPVNGNFGIIDNAFGGTATIALTNAPVILSSAQYQNVFITFTGALSGNCAITFPVVGSCYTVQNLTSNTSSFQVTLQTTAAGTQAIGCPWNEPFDIMTDSVGNVKFRNIGRVGEFWEYAGSSVPTWVSNCTIPPYLNCDGTVFSSGAYPILTTILGGTTLPDLRGRYRVPLNQGAGRITSGSSTGGVDGNTNLATGGSETTTLSSQNVPPVPVVEHSHLAVGPDPVVTPTSTLGSLRAIARVLTGNGDIDYLLVGSTAAANIGRTSTEAIVAGSTSPTNFSNLPPTQVVGITMIRAG